MVTGASLFVVKIAFGQAVHNADKAFNKASFPCHKQTVITYHVIKVWEKIKKKPRYKKL